MSAPTADPVPPVSGTTGDSAPPVPTTAPGPVPPYVLNYAPLVWLDKHEIYMPSDIGSQLLHTTPRFKYNPVTGYPTPLTLSNLDSLNAHGGANVFLTANDDIAKGPVPEWLKGVTPDPVTHKANGTTSCCIIVRDHNDGTGFVDAFYFYFYAYNQGNRVIGLEWGDHVGDIEHNMIRFKDGVPQAMAFSQHASGEYFTYDAVEKHGIRPISYSAKGSHANYGIPGTHDHTIPDHNMPDGLVEDHSSAGTLWDPALTAYIYAAISDATNTKVTDFAPYNGTDPVAWLHFQGHWGDQEGYKGRPLGKYVGGPDGPQNKALVRKNVWADSDKGAKLKTKLSV